MLFHLTFCRKFNQFARQFQIASFWLDRKGLTDRVKDLNQSCFSWEILSNKKSKFRLFWKEVWDIRVFLVLGFSQQQVFGFINRTPKSPTQKITSGLNQISHRALESQTGLMNFGGLTFRGGKMERRRGSLSLLTDFIRWLNKGLFCFTSQELSRGTNRILAFYLLEFID